MATEALGAGAAALESGLSLLQPKHAKTSANGTKNLAIGDVSRGASFAFVSTRLRVRAICARRRFVVVATP
ncbi:MAG TPA: hypothetical protein VH044_20855 [Polyangiaceae bacterium]|jgi:hypothetical protein|nr:hypothetical protein [Polyangiaceae bacterium]